MVVEKNKRKSVPQTQTPSKAANTPQAKKPKFERPEGGTPFAKKSPGKPQTPSPAKTPAKMKVEVVKNGNNKTPVKKEETKPLNTIQKGKGQHPIQKKKNFDGPKGKGGFKGQKPPHKQQQQQSDNKGQHQHKPTKKNRYKRLQNRMDNRERSEESCARAMKLEVELTQQSGRVLTVKLPDTLISQDVIKKWSGAVENAIFPKPVEPRQFLVILKPKSNVKKEVENLRKITFGGGKLVVDERNDFEKGFDDVSKIDPFTLYLTNLPMDVTKEVLKDLFPKSDHILNPRKHNPTKAAGNQSKFTFVSFKSAEDALEGLREKYNAEVMGRNIIMRFRRLSQQELHQNNQAKTSKESKKEAAATPAKGAGAAAGAATPKVEANKKKAVAAVVSKVQVKQEDSDDDDEDDDEDMSGSDEDDNPEGLEAEEDSDDGKQNPLGAEEEDEDDDDEDDDEDDDDDDDDDD